MKFILATLSSLTLAVSASSILTPTNEVTTNVITSDNYTWNNVAINHSINTAAAGTDSKEDTTVDSKATAQPWDIFLNAQQLIASGYFAFHTYDGAIYLSETVLNLNEDASSDTFRQWEFTKTNDVWQGWGHQTSTITLTVTAKYDDSEKLTSLTAKSYIYARTAGSVHSCSTTSQISTIQFVGS